MPSTEQLPTVREESAAPSETPSTQKTSLGNQEVEELVQALRAETGQFRKLFEEFNGKFSKSKNLKVDLGDFLSAISICVIAIDSVGRDIHNSELAPANIIEETLEAWAHSIEREISVGIDTLLSGPDLSLRERFEELRKRLALPGTGSNFTAKDPCRRFREIADQIAASIH